ncbi:MAG: hypothetical protein WCA36_03430, partial [Pseudolabrys sp.]
MEHRTAAIVAISSGVRSTPRPQYATEARRARGLATDIHQIQSGDAIADVLSLNIIGFKQFLTRQNRHGGIVH